MNGFSEKLDAFPTVGQPILDSALKDMLITLRGALQHDMSNFMKQTNKEIAAIGDRVDYIENKLSDYALAYNEVVDTHDNLADKIRNLKIKMADIEDHSRPNNVKFRGISKTIPPAELCPYLQKMIAELQPVTKTHKLAIHRAHSLPKPSYLEHVPRDVIAKIHHFHVKDQLMHHHILASRYI